MFFNELLNHPEIKAAFGSRQHHFSTELRRLKELRRRKPGQGSVLVEPVEAAKLIISLCACESVNKAREAVALYYSAGEETPTLLKLVTMAIEDGVAQFEQLQFEGTGRAFVVWSNGIGHYTTIERNNPIQISNGITVPAVEQAATPAIRSIRIVEADIFENLHNQIFH